ERADPAEAARRRELLDRLPPRLSEALERLREEGLDDPDAREQLDELLDELQNIKDLEDFTRRYGDLFHGPQSLSYAEAVELMRALTRRPGTPLDLHPGDFVVYGSAQTTTSSTVLLLDMSWSMSWEGRFAAAKKVALAMESLIRARYPRDYFAIVGFFTRAVELRLRDLPEASWNMGDPFTNLQDGLRVAADRLARHPSNDQ